MRILNEVDAQQLRELLARGEFFWLDLSCPDASTIERVGQLLGLHRLAIEDTQEFGQRAKCDTYGEHLLMVYFGATRRADGRPKPIEVHLHVSGGFVLTVHRERCERFEEMQERLRASPPTSEQLLVYRVLDALTDSILDVLEKVSDEIDVYETEVFSRPKARLRDEMAMLRRSLGNLRRVLVNQRQVFERAVGRLESLPGLDPDLTSYYRDVGDHLWRAFDEVEAARDSLQGMLDTYANEVNERLTIVATIFLPLTLLTGFFGQNFTWMINHIGAAAAFWGLGVGGMTVSVAAVVVWLRRSGLHHPGRQIQLDGEEPVVGGPPQVRS